MNDLFAAFKEVPNDQKKAFGQALNQLKQAIQDKLDEGKTRFSENIQQSSGLDLSRPVAADQLGSRHPLSLVRNEIVEIFIDNFGPPGDSLIEVDNFKKVAPFSTIGGSFIFNSIISHVAELCKNEEIFPFYISGNMPQATEHNEKLLKLYMDRNPHI